MNKKELMERVIDYQDDRIVELQSKNICLKHAVDDIQSNSTLDGCRISALEELLRYNDIDFSNIIVGITANE